MGEEGWDAVPNMDSRILFISMVLFYAEKKEASPQTWQVVISNAHVK